MIPLQIFEKHPGDGQPVYRVGGSFTPYFIVAVDKRFTDAELAAEYWREAREFLTEAKSAGERLDRIARWMTVNRFATLPHFDA